MVAESAVGLVGPSVKSLIPLAVESRGRRSAPHLAVLPVTGSATPLLIPRSRGQCPIQKGGVEDTHASAGPTKMVEARTIVPITTKNLPWGMEKGRL
ncbi:hypothetical protein B7R77_07645 [Ralstonia solanacearum K60]|uniref:Uncharacterized protein n=1 Tax=Ralstonia solanacearum K60 TaxID=1091042 RepID=A0AAP7ZM56_RALSL|nr:hypothetical protein B7R77_07645 [Ralstonia solanacearum K60]